MVTVIWPLKSSEDQVSILEETMQNRYKSVAERQLKDWVCACHVTSQSHLYSYASQLFASSSSEQLLLSIQPISAN